MRAATDLGKLFDAYAYRLLRIRRLFGLALNVGEPRRGECIAISVIELDNLLISSLRALTISTLRGARTSSRVRISLNRRIDDEEEISAYLLQVVEVRTYNRLGQPARVARKFEPKIRDPRTTEKVFIDAAASNLISLQNALSINSNLFHNLPTLRNFYAHRNDDTWRKVKVKSQALGIFGINHANEFVTAIMRGRPVTVFEDWLDEAEIFFEEATK